MTEAIWHPRSTTNSCVTAVDHLVDLNFWSKFAVALSRVCLYLAIVSVATENIEKGDTSVSHRGEMRFTVR